MPKTRGHCGNVLQYSTVLTLHVSRCTHAHIYKISPLLLLSSPPVPPPFIKTPSPYSSMMPLLLHPLLLTHQSFCPFPHLLLSLYVLFLYYFPLFFLFPSLLPIFLHFYLLRLLIFLSFLLLLLLLFFLYLSLFLLLFFLYPFLLFPCSQIRSCWSPGEKLFPTMDVMGFNSRETVETAVIMCLSAWKGRHLLVGCDLGVQRRVLGVAECRELGRQWQMNWEWSALETLTPSLNSFNGVRFFLQNF